VRLPEKQKLPNYVPFFREKPPYLTRKKYLLTSQNALQLTGFTEKLSEANEQSISQLITCPFYI
jgi:hypothetical protein